MKMIYLGFIFFLTAFSLTLSQEIDPYIAAGCEVEGITSAHWMINYDNAAILDTFEGDIATFTTANVNDVKVTGTEYFDAELDSDGILTLFTTEDYKYIEPTIGYQALPRIRFNLEFACSTGNVTLRFIQPLTDTNNHDPYFEKSQYVFIYQGKNFSSNYRLTDDQNITAIDIDMTNNGMIFTLEENEYFSISTNRTLSATRQTFANLLTLNAITPPFSTKLILNATDVTQPNRTSSTTIEIDVLYDTEDVPNPQFSSSSYIGTCKNGKVTFPEEIRLSSGAGYLADLTQSGFEEYFETSFKSRADGTFQVQLLEGIDVSILGDRSVFQIEVSNEGASESTSATIEIIILEDDQVQEEEIDEEINDYDDIDDEVNEDDQNEDNIVDDNVDNAEEENIDYDDEVVDDEDDKVVDGQEEDQVVDDEDTLGPSNSCSTGPALAQFTYVAKYDNGFLSFEDDIRVMSDNLDLDVIQTGWEDYFETKVKHASVIVSVKESLPTSVLENNAFILFDIKVIKYETDSTVCSAGASILIELPKTCNSESFSFENSTYLAYYNGNRLLLEREIFLTGDVKDTEIVITQNDYSDNFALEYSPSNNMISVKMSNLLEQSDFSRGIISFQMKATKAETSVSAVTTIVISWDGPLPTRTIIYYSYISMYLYFFLFLSLAFSSLGLLYVKRRRRMSLPRYQEFEKPPRYA